jgi:aldehyde oxidoreductase
LKAEGKETLFKGEWGAVGNREPIDPNTGEGDPMQDHNHIVQIARVEVDPATGRAEVVAVHSAADVGVVGNRLALDGQAIGGLAHAIGFALYEEYSDFDKKYETMTGCGIATANQIPDDIEFIYQETPREGGPLGSGGASECFQSCGHVSVINAIENAVGVRICELPATPDKILAALNSKAQGKELKPAKWYLGESFDDVVADIKANPVTMQPMGPPPGDDGPGGGPEPPVIM